jgi:hypothetical protein
MHQLSVCALFKNESHCILEWIQHYLFHGVEHFYLLDDESEDDYQCIIQPYIDNGTITLVKVSWDRYYGRQKDIYNHYMLPLLHETQWLLICDLDEFMWSPQSIDLKGVLSQCFHLAEIQVVQTLFGSNGHSSQPKSLVQSFTKRRNSQFGSARTHGYKYFIHSRFAFKELNVHYAIPEEEGKNNWLILSDEWFILNHYCCQSKDFFLKKCNRSDVNEFKKLTIDDFLEFDTNEVEDSRLYEQNKEIIYNLK